jgi:hypothetical protein
MNKERNWIRFNNTEVEGSVKGSGPGDRNHYLPEMKSSKNALLDSSYATQITVVRRPDTTHALVQTCHRLLGALQLLAVGLLQDVGLLHNFAGLKVPHADGLLVAIDVVTLDNRVLCWSWGDADFDLGVFTGKGSKILC